MKLTYRAVIFDLDGTLLDTLADIAMAANDVLAALGQETHGIADYRFMVGDGVSMLFQRACPMVLEDRILLQRCIDLFEQFYAIRWKESSGPYTEIPELLDWLTVQGIPMSVLSNKPHPFTCQCVSVLLSKWQFHAVLGQRPETPRKPDPLVFMKSNRNFRTLWGRLWPPMRSSMLAIPIPICKPPTRRGVSR